MLTEESAKKKKILFVTYGGGHVTIVDPICRRIAADQLLDFRILALTAAWKKVEGTYPPGVVKKISDYLFLFEDRLEEVLRLGLRILPENYCADLGISKLESIAYLGLSFHDAILSSSVAQAEELYREKGRLGFFPLETMRQIILHEQPDVIVATSSPRCELAAIQIGNELGIPTVQIADLFVPINIKLIAENIIVMNEDVASKLARTGIERNRIHPFGQPAFDTTRERVATISPAEAKRKAGLDASERALLLGTGDLCTFNPDLTVKEFLRYEDYVPGIFRAVSRAAKQLNCRILLRLHPSESVADYQAFLKNFPEILYSNQLLNLYEALAASDWVAAPCSSISIDAAVCGKPIFTYELDGDFNFPIVELSQPPFSFCRGMAQLEEKLGNALQASVSPGPDFCPPGAVGRIADFLHDRAYRK